MGASIAALTSPLQTFRRDQSCPLPGLIDFTFPPTRRHAYNRRHERLTDPPQRIKFKSAAVANLGIRYTRFHKGTSVTTNCTNEPNPSVLRRASRTATAGVAGALGGLGLFMLTSISLTMAISAEGPFRQMATLSRLPRADFERLYWIGHIVAFVVFVAAGATAGILHGRLQIGAHWRWMVYGAMTGVAFVVLVSYVVETRFPNAQSFDYSENAAFEYKFRAAQFLGVLGGVVGGVVGMLFHQLKPRRLRNDV